MVDKSLNESNIRDYKFLCFDGKVACVWVDVNRSLHHERQVFDVNWNLLDVSIDGFPIA